MATTQDFFSDDIDIVGTFGVHLSHRPATPTFEIYDRYFVEQLDIALQRLLDHVDMVQGWRRSKYGNSVADDSVPGHTPRSVRAHYLKIVKAFEKEIEEGITPEEGPDFRYHGRIREGGGPDFWIEDTAEAETTDVTPSTTSSSSAAPPSAKETIIPTGDIHSIRRSILSSYICKSPQETQPSVGEKNILDGQICHQAPLPTAKRKRVTPSSSSELETPRSKYPKKLDQDHVRARSWNLEKPVSEIKAFSLPSPESLNGDSRST